MSRFLDEDYQEPRSSANYMKLQTGDNKIRILSAPIMGWEDWKDNKPIRFRPNDKPANPIDPKRPVKYFWAMIVWNYRESKIQILQLPSATCRKAIEALNKDEAWGEPFFYDINIRKTGEKMDTEYMVTAYPPKDLLPEIRQAFNAKRCWLPALYDGADPFASDLVRFTPGIFEKASSNDSNWVPDKPEAPTVRASASVMDQLKATLSAEGTPTHMLEQFIEFYAKEKGVNAEATARSAIKPGVYGNFKKLYTDYMAKQQGAA